MNFQINGIATGAVECIFHGTVLGSKGEGVGVLIMPDKSIVAADYKYTIMYIIGHLPPQTYEISEKDVSILKLQKKRKDYLYFSTCNSANPDVKNVAQAFNKIADASIILGWDGGTVFI